MSKTERDQLNEEYAQAYQRFETWRQKHIEKFEQEDRLQHFLGSIPERLGQHARAHHIEAFLSSSDYKYECEELTEADERACFKLDDSMKIPSNTWRDNHNSASSISAEARLGQFERQVAATDARGIQARSYNKERQRANARASTTARLEAELKEEKEKEKAIEKNKRRHVKKLDTGPNGTLPGDRLM